MHFTLLFCIVLYCTVVSLDQNVVKNHVFAYNTVHNSTVTSQLGLAIIGHMKNMWMITLYCSVLQILDCLRVLHNALSFAPLFKWIVALGSAFYTLSKPFAHCFLYGECFTQMNIVHSTIRSLSKPLKIVGVLHIVSSIQSNVSSDLRCV